ncbi:MAG: hypothetical protein KGH64_04275 [Candidatus Micrarchaeota archaeon]|nr:hypothetical protein [Candidatus Micrarchaeota archaeon]
MAKWGVVVGSKDANNRIFGDVVVNAAAGEWCIKYTRLKYTRHNMNIMASYDKEILLFNTRREARQWAKDATARTNIKYYAKKYSE